MIFMSCQFLIVNIISSFEVLNKKTYMYIHVIHVVFTSAIEHFQITDLNHGKYQYTHVFCSNINFV